MNRHGRKGARGAAAAAALAIAFAAGAFWRGAGGRAGHAAGHGAEASAEGPSAAARVWTCSMHPQIRLPAPGRCPLCFMDLVPVAEATREGGGAPRELALGRDAAERLRVETSRVERRFVEAEVRMTGKVDYDETRTAYLTAWVPGRLERLHVDFTGREVSAGDPMVTIFSPALLSAQEELLQAARAAAALGGGGLESVRLGAEATAEAARGKLALLGLSPRQIAAIEARGAAEDRVVLHAPAGGTVVRKTAQEGLYVEAGTRLYTLADLSRVWVQLDAYESDLPKLQPGQPVRFEAEALPGRRFGGAVAFIAPVVDEASRTVRVRVDVPNRDRALRPGMFVRAAVAVALGEQGPVSPSAPDAEPPLVVPASAPLLTGRRAIVYVQVPGRERPTYEAREVRLGPRAGGDYLVAAGLEEGERVVTRGAFQLDAELQIRAGRGMMSAAAATGRTPAGGTPAVAPPASDPALRARLGRMVGDYLAVQRALVSDDADAAREAAAAAVRRFDGDRPGQAAGDAWGPVREALAAAVRGVAEGGDLAAQRVAFHAWSGRLVEAARRFGADGEPPRLAHCPMAFGNRGADWLQRGEVVSNPYFGAAMLRCGEVRGAAW